MLAHINPYWSQRLVLRAAISRTVKRGVVGRMKFTAVLVVGCAAVALTACNPQASNDAAGEGQATSQQAAPDAPTFVPPGEEVGQVILTPAGYGPYQIDAPIPKSAVAVKSSGPDGRLESCTVYEDPDIVGLAIESDGSVVTRLIVTSPSGIETGAGIAIGSEVEAIRSGYPQLLEAPRLNGSAIVNLYAGNVDKGALRFEIGEDGRVLAMYAGRDPQLSGVNTCP